MQKIELIAIDIDNTLIPPGTEEISQENREAVALAKSRGIKVTLATGRIYSHAERAENDLHIDVPLIALNGADIRHNGKTLKKSVIPIETVINLMDKTKKFPDSARMIFSGGGVYAERTPRNRALIERMKKIIVDENSTFQTYPDCESIYPIVEGDVRKVLLWANDKDEFTALNEALRPLSSEYEITNSEGYNIEVNKKGVSKDNGLAYIADYLGIPMASVLAIGDSGNDIAMLKNAGVGVAMANATKEALEAADYTTVSCEENGVANAIYKFALGL